MSLLVICAAQLLVYAAADDPFASQRAKVDLLDQGALCNACYQFPIGDGGLLITSQKAPSICSPDPRNVALTNVTAESLAFVVDPLLTATDGNSYHVHASILRATLLAMEYREGKVPARVILPDKWKQHPWVVGVFGPQFKAIGVQQETHAPIQQFCVKGWSVPTLQRQPYTVENVFTARGIIESVCKLSLLSISKSEPSPKDVLLVSSSKALVKGAQLRRDNLLELTSSLDQHKISYDLVWPEDDDPCEQARLFAKPYRLIVAPMGAYMTGLIAVHPRTPVIQVDPGSPKFAFCRLTYALGNRWVHFVANNDGSERFIFPNCTAHNDSRVVPTCAEGLGPKERFACAREFWAESRVTLSRRDKITIVEMIRIMLGGAAGG